MEIRDIEKRWVVAQNVYTKDKYLVEMLHSAQDITTEDMLLVINLSPIGFTDNYGIVIPKRYKQGLDSIKIRFKNNSIEIREDSIYIFHGENGENGLIELLEDRISIKIGNSKNLHEGDKIEINSPTVHIPGMPDQTEPDSKGGFSKILYCPFTGLPHNTEKVINPL